MKQSDQDFGFFRLDFTPYTIFINSTFVPFIPKVREIVEDNEDMQILTDEYKEEYEPLDTGIWEEEEEDPLSAWLPEKKIITEYGGLILTPDNSKKLYELYLKVTQTIESLEESSMELKSEENFLYKRNAYINLKRAYLKSFYIKAVNLYFLVKSGNKQAEYLMNEINEDIIDVFLNGTKVTVSRKISKNKFENVTFNLLYKQNRPIFRTILECIKSKMNFFGDYVDKSPVIPESEIRTETAISLRSRYETFVDKTEGSVISQYVYNMIKDIDLLKNHVEKIESYIKQEVWRLIGALVNYQIHSRRRLFLNLKDWYQWTKLERKSLFSDGENTYNLIQLEEFKSEIKILKNQGEMQEANNMKLFVSGLQEKFYNVKPIIFSNDVLEDITFKANIAKYEQISEDFAGGLIGKNFFLPYSSIVDEKPRNFFEKKYYGENKRDFELNDENLVEEEVFHVLIHKQEPLTTVWSRFKRNAILAVVAGFLTITPIVLGEGAGYVIAILKDIGPPQTIGSSEKSSLKPIQARLKDEKTQEVVNIERRLIVSDKRINRLLKIVGKEPSIYKAAGGKIFEIIDLAKGKPISYIYVYTTKEVSIKLNFEPKITKNHLRFLDVKPTIETDIVNLIREDLLKAIKVGNFSNRPLLSVLYMLSTFLAKIPRTFSTPEERYIKEKQELTDSYGEKRKSAVSIISEGFKEGEFNPEAHGEDISKKTLEFVSNSNLRPAIKKYMEFPSIDNFNKIHVIMMYFLTADPIWTTVLCFEYCSNLLRLRDELKKVVFFDKYFQIMSKHFENYETQEKTGPIQVKKLFDKAGVKDAIQNIRLNDPLKVAAIKTYLDKIWLEIEDIVEKVFLISSTIPGAKLVETVLLEAMEIELKRLESLVEKKFPGKDKGFEDPVFLAKEKMNVYIIKIFPWNDYWDEINRFIGTNIKSPPIREETMVSLVRKVNDGFRVVRLKEPRTKKNFHVRAVTRVKNDLLKIIGDELNYIVEYKNIISKGFRVIPERKKDISPIKRIEKSKDQHERSYGNPQIIHFSQKIS